MDSTEQQGYDTSYCLRDVHLSCLSIRGGTRKNKNHCHFWSQSVFPQCSCGYMAKRFLFCCQSKRSHKTLTTCPFKKREIDNRPQVTTRILNLYKSGGGAGEHRMFSLKPTGFQTKTTLTVKNLFCCCIRFIGKENRWAINLVWLEMRKFALSLAAIHQVRLRARRGWRRRHIRRRLRGGQDMSKKPMQWFDRIPVDHLCHGIFHCWESAVWCYSSAEVQIRHVRKQIREKIVFSGLQLSHVSWRIQDTSQLGWKILKKKKHQCHHVSFVSFQQQVSLGTFQYAACLLQLYGENHKNQPSWTNDSMP